MNHIFKYDDITFKVIPVFRKHSEVQSAVIFSSRDNRYFVDSVDFTSNDSRIIFAHRCASKLNCTAEKIEGVLEELTQSINSEELHHAT